MSARLFLCMFYRSFNFYFISVHVKVSDLSPIVCILRILNTQYKLKSIAVGNQRADCMFVITYYVKRCGLLAFQFVSKQRTVVSCDVLPLAVKVVRHYTGEVQVSVAIITISNVIIIIVKVITVLPHHCQQVQSCFQQADTQLNNCKIGLSVDFRITRWHGSARVF